MTRNRKTVPYIHVYRVPDNPHLLRCVMCGQPPDPGTKAMEANYGEPRLICSACVATAVIGFEDIDRSDAGYSALTSPF